ncbi:MAG: glycosyltransferase, partial [Lachnospiraceae bacterium]|nr:glycosyltransferase [Lachnospiraceae bacterium]
MLISVIVPVYNAGVYLEKCVNSILDQTFTDFELLLVDDGSTDSSVKLCDEFAAKDPRVKVIHQTNAGSSAARNAGIKASAGSFLSFVDSDDWVDPDFLERLSEPVLRSLEAGGKIDYIVQIGRDETDGEGNTLPDICIPPDKPTMISGKDFLKTLLLHEGDCSMCTKLVSRDLFKAREFPEGKLNEDFKVLIYMLLDCKGVLSLPGHKYHVFYKPESNTRKTDKN